MVSGNVELLDEFYEKLNNCDQPVLLLDYDGTLAPFTVDRFQAVPSPGVREVLDEIGSDGRTRIVFISGRNASEVVQLAGLRKPIEVWGCHGREHLSTDGDVEIIGLTDTMKSGLKKGELCARDVVPSDRVETKTGCVAVHWRGMSGETVQGIEGDLRAIWQPIADSGDLAIKTFDGGLELMAPGRTKGDVVEQILRELEGNDHAVAFLGDDLTDEDGFRALGDDGLAIIVRNDDRESAASVRLRQPEGLLEFLHKWQELASREED